MDSIPTQKKAYLRTKYSLEFMYDFPFSEMFREAAARFRKDGYEPITHFHTFYGDDFRDRWATFDLVSYVPQFFIMTAPVDKWEEAVNWVNDNNKHLEITAIGEPDHLNDEFSRNVQTAKIFFTIKSLL